MSYREAVTLQIGHYANYVGAHFWNIQESSFVYSPAELKGPKEVCHDVLFREGTNPKKEVTFTPRLIAFDLKGSLKTLKQEGSLYETDQEEDEIRWLGDVTMHREVPAGKNAFLRNLETEEKMSLDTTDHEDVMDKERFADKEEAESTKRKRTEESDSVSKETKDPAASSLNTTVTTWSDFLRTHYHPRSVHVVEEYRHSDELRPFDLFNCADEIFSNYEETCEWENRIRRFVEECDHLQGFQIMLDTHDGFGGLGAGILTHIKEEYPGKSVLTFGLTPSNTLDDTAQARSSRIINSALAYDKACNHSSLFVPFSLATSLWRTVGPLAKFPHLSYENLSYHTSAILASAIETLSLPYRMETGSCHMRDITHTFNAQGRKLGSIYTSMPLGLHENESLVDFFCNFDGDFPWVPLTPHVRNENAQILMQSVVCRGIWDKQVKSLTDPRKLQEYLVGCETVDEALERYLDKKCPNVLTAKTRFQSTQKVQFPFPNIFNENVNKFGRVTSSRRSENQFVNEVPMMTSLQCNSEMGGVVDQLYGAAVKMNIKKHHRYLELGLEEDDYSEVLDNLKTLVSNYKLETEGL